MKRTTTLLATLLLLPACSPQRPPFYAFRNVSDQLKALFGGMIGFPCTAPKLKQGSIEHAVPVEDCYRLEQPKVMTGIWLKEFEASRFVPDATQPPQVWRWTINDTELTPAQNLSKKYADLAYSPPRSAFAITFIGRAVSYPPSNRWGGRDRLVVMYKVLALKALPAPRKTIMCLPECEPI